MKIKNICFVITKSEVGGAQKWVKEQIEVLNNAGFTCFISTNQEGWLTERSKTEASLINKGIERRLSRKYLFNLVDFVKENEIDLIVGNSANGGIYTRLAAKLAKVKCIYVSHGWSSIYNGGKLAFVYNFVERILSRFTSKVLCVSQNDYDLALTKIKIKEDKLVVIPNKIFPVETEGAPEHVPTDNPIKILFLGRISAPKLPFQLIKAVEGKENYRLDIVGGGPDFDSIKEYIKSHHVINVRLLGEIKDFVDFKNYAIFGLISASEGLPLSAVEALSCGLPILISDVGGCSEVIDNNGYLTNNDVEDIRRGLDMISEKIALYAENSVKLFSTKFDLSKNAHEYIDLYESV